MKDTQDAPFEWILAYEGLGLQSLFGELLELYGHDAVIVVPGCGTSDLSAALHRDAGFKRIISIDNNIEIITAMQEKHNATTGLDFYCADLSIPCTDLVADGSAHIVVDKSTLDLFFCNERGASHFCATVYRMLQEGGHYIVISFHPAKSLRSFLALWFQVESCTELPRSNGRHTVHVLVLRKQPQLVADATDADALHAHTVGALDAWYQDCTPLLTPEREMELTCAWDNALEKRDINCDTSSHSGNACDSDITHALREAYYLMFHGYPEEQEYSFEDFLLDVSAQTSAKTNGSNIGDGGDTFSVESTLWTLDDAIGFLRAMQ